MLFFLKKVTTDFPVDPRPYIKKDSSLKFLTETIYLSFKVASPTRAKIIAIIQNLITIVDSAHPFFSK